MSSVRAKDRERERARRRVREGRKNSAVISQVSTLGLAQASSWNAGGRARKQEQERKTGREREKMKRA